MARWLSVFALVLLLLGCAGPSSRTISAWDVVDAHGNVSTIELPARLDDVLAAGDRSYVLRTTIDTAPGGPAQDLLIEGLPAPVRLIIDGHSIDSRDAPTEFGYAPPRPWRWEVPEEARADGELTITLAVDRTWHAATWLHSVPRLVPHDQQTPAEKLVRWVNGPIALAAAVGLLQLGFTCVLVYAWDRRRAPYLWFGIQGLSAMAYPLLVAGVLRPVMGFYEVAFTANALLVALTVSVHFTHGFFRLGSAPRLFWAAMVCGMVLNVATAGPFSIHIVGLPFTVLCIVVVMSYQLFTYVKLVRARPEKMQALFLLLAWAGLGGFSWPDMVAWLGWADLLQGARTGAVGLAWFSVFQSLAFSHSHITSLNTRDALNGELEGRIEQLEARRTEIEGLNAELRRQIGNRSAQLYAALALGERGPVAQPHLVAGTVVEGRYKVVRSLGAGGMASVYAVERTSDHKRLALKVTRESDGVALARLAREAQIASQVNHPNVVQIVDVDVSTAGFLYIVMELVDGCSLQDLRERFGPCEWSMRVLCDVARGLAVLHERGIIHRDLKPGNILLSGDITNAPVVKITDFGISKLEDLEQVVSTPAQPVENISGDGSEITGPSVDETPAVPRTDPNIERPDVDAESTLMLSGFLSEVKPSSGDVSSLTVTGSIAGTPRYMAPEMTLGAQAATPAVDVFALGVLAFELLTGAYPFAETMLSAAHGDRPFPVAASLRNSCSILSDRCAEILQRCLTLEPHRRPTIREVLEVLTAELKQPIGTSA